MMTNRVKGFTVTLDQDIRDDDVEAILNAVRVIKHVIHVEPSIVTVEDHMNRERIRYQLQSKLIDALKE